MLIPEVNPVLLEELEAMGFPRGRATRALHFSGNSTLEDAINWVINHENDADIDEMPLVDVSIMIDSSQEFSVTEEMRIKAQKLRDEASKKKEEEEKKLKRERAREKERIHACNQLTEAKRIAEENERKRIIELRKAEKEQEKRARERVLRRLEQDKVNRRSVLGLPLKVNPPENSIPQEKMRKPIYNVSKTEQLREALRSVKKNHQGEGARVRTAYETLFIYIRNVVKNPDEERYRKIRLSNSLFQDRVGSLAGGVEFLEVCGFERLGNDEFLYLPRDKVNIAILNSAGTLLICATTNPFFGVLSTQA